MLPLLSSNFYFIIGRNSTIGWMQTRGYPKKFGDAMTAGSGSRVSYFRILGFYKVLLKSFPLVISERGCRLLGRAGVSGREYLRFKSRGRQVRVRSGARELLGRTVVRSSVRSEALARGSGWRLWIPRPDVHEGIARQSTTKHPYVKLECTTLFQNEK